MNITPPRTHRRPVRALIAAAGLVTIALSFVPAHATASCLDWQQNLLDTSSSCVASASIERFSDLVTLRWQGGSYLLIDTGNDLGIFDLGPAPLAPTAIAASDFQVPHLGDSDYDLLSSSVCDDCRFGAAFYKLGLVVFDLGSGATPDITGSTFLAADTSYPGGLVFSFAGAEYLLVSAGVGSCGDTPTLFRVEPGPAAPLLTAIGCPSISNQAGRVVGGSSIVRGASTTLWVGDHTGSVYVLRVVDDGDGISLQTVDQPFALRADTRHGSGLAVDEAAGVAVTAFLFGGVRLWNIADAEHPQPLWGDPDLVVSRAALHWPLLWVGRFGTVLDSRTFDLSDPFRAVEIASEVWDPAQPWNSAPCSADQDAVFAPDGGGLYLGRYSVAQVYDPSQCDGLASSLILVDSFDSGTLAAWSDIIP